MKLHSTILILWLWGSICTVLGMYINALLSMNHDKPLIERESIMYNRKVFWTCVFFCTLGIIIGVTVCGCKPLPPSKTVSGIKHGSDGINTGWFVYVYDTGDVDTKKGVAMSSIITRPYVIKNNGVGGLMSEWADPSIQDIKTSGITDENGQVIVKGKVNNWASVGYWIQSRADIYFNNGTHADSAVFGYSTLGPQRVQRAATDGGRGTVPRLTSVAGTLTSDESAAISGTTSDPPASGISVASCDLIQRQGNAGKSTIQKLKYLTAGNLSKPSDYFKHSAPEQLSIIFKTASPVDITGTKVSATIKTDACPAGITLDITIIGSNADKTTHVARTEAFLPVDSTIQVPPTISVYDNCTPFADPNIWDSNQYVIVKRPDWLSLVDPNLYDDPNLVPDPNVFFDPHNPAFFTFTNRLDTETDDFDMIYIPSRVMQIKTIALGATDDTLDIDINWSDPRLILLIAPNWLSTNRVFDINNDGIVNLGDWL